MPGKKCPFSIVQAAGSCQCCHAEEVVRRGGSEFDCLTPSAYEICSQLTQHLNAVGLPALGYEDDLTLTPKSIYERILLGGLQGLRLAEDPQDGELQTQNIWTVVERATIKYVTLTHIPDSDIIPAIKNCQIKKRRRKK